MFSIAMKTNSSIFAQKNKKVNTHMSLKHPISISYLLFLEHLSRKRVTLYLFMLFAKFSIEVLVGFFTAITDLRNPFMYLGH
jgi:hypothetical protein